MRVARSMVAVLMLAATGAAASVPTLDECFEGSDFIADAAWSRDHGLSREAFLAQLSGDFQAIHAFPPSLRWFAKDEDDEHFLFVAASGVFDVPVTADLHRAQFLNACFERLAATGGDG